jgi:predicted FMN-binding regulatory protein PaiB
LDEAESFASGQPHGTLVVAAPDGWPQVTILPFVKEDDRILLHAVREDPTCEALRETDRATFFVSEFLAFTPHDWVEARNAARGTLHFRAISYECRASVDDSPEAVAAVLRRILERYEPGADYEPVVDGDFYGPRLRRLCAITLDVVERKAKFKVGSYGPDTMKLDVAGRLRERGSHLDVHAADLIEAAVHGRTGDLAPGRAPDPIAD